MQKAILYMYSVFDLATPVILSVAALYLIKQSGILLEHSGRVAHIYAHAAYRHNGKDEEHTFS